MASTAAEAKVGSQGLFVRNATGLVRELNAFDAFNLVFSAVLIPVGITQVMGFTPQFWPHANMLASFAIATPLVLCFGLVYLYFTQLMPRSGATTSGSPGRCTRRSASSSTSRSRSYS